MNHIGYFQFLVLKPKLFLVAPYIAASQVSTYALGRVRSPGVMEGTEEITRFSIGKIGKIIEPDANHGAEKLTYKTEPFSFLM